MSDEITGRGVRVTIKYGKGYEETWAIFTGLPREVREDICEFFGIDSASVSGLNLNELVTEATSLAHAMGNVGAALGARPIDRETGKPAQRKGDAPATNDDGSPFVGGSDPWAADSVPPVGEQPAAEDPNARLRSAIEAAETVEALKLLWADNQEALSADAELLAQWKARGRTLKAAA